MAISLVGTPTCVGAGAGGNCTVTLPTMSNNDVIIAFGGWSAARAGTNPGSTGAGYTQVYTQNSTGLAFWVGYKFTDGTDTQFVGQGTGVAGDATVYGVIVLRGVSTSTPQDATATTNSADTNPAAITTVTDQAWVLPFTGNAISDAFPGSMTGYSNLFTGHTNSTNKLSIVGATKTVSPAGSEDPPSCDAWASVLNPINVTTAWRPAGAGGPSAGPFTDTTGSTDTLAYIFGDSELDDTGLTDSVAINGTAWTQTPTDNSGLTDTSTVVKNPGGTNWTQTFTDSAGLSEVLSMADGFVTEATPPITWTYSGTYPQQAWQVIIQDANRDQILHNSGKITSTATSYTLPAKIIHPGNVYTLRVRVWDTISRQAVAPDHAFIEKIKTFDYVTTGSGVVSALAVTDLTPVPAAKLTWTDGTAPDSYTIVRDQKVIATGVLPQDVLVSGTSYAYTDNTAHPRAAHTWEVRRVVNHVTSQTNPTATTTLTPRGIWLLDNALSIQQIIMGDDAGTWGMGEQADVFVPIGGTKSVRVTQGLRGYEGNVSGVIGALTLVGQTLAQAEQNMWDLKRRAGRTYQLVLSNLSIPVIIGNVVIAPTPAPDLTKSVSFDFWQVDDLDFTPVL